MTDQVSEMDGQELLLAEMYDSRINRYSCTCNKTYKTKGHFKRHLEKEHEWDFALNQDTKKFSNAFKGGSCCSMASFFHETVFSAQRHRRCISLR